jgi:hypothetical protein
LAEISALVIREVIGVARRQLVEQRYYLILRNRPVLEAAAVASHATILGSSPYTGTSPGDRVRVPGR